MFAFGHIGDGNIHFCLFEPKDGSFSAEYGVGLAKKQELKKYKSHAELKLMREIKKTIDPNNIMNPGKVL